MSKLYWVTTQDHDEDWFVVAPTSKAAEIFHEDAEGYDRNYAKAVYICDVPKKVLEKYPLPGGASAWWPDNELIAELGAEITNTDNTRVVKFMGKTYVEGLLESVVEKARRDAGLGVLH